MKFPVIKDLLLYITFILVLVIGIYLLICRPTCSNKDHFTLGENTSASFLITDPSGNISTMDDTDIVGLLQRVGNLESDLTAYKSQMNSNLIDQKAHIEQDIDSKISTATQNMVNYGDKMTVRNHDTACENKYNYLINKCGEDIWVQSGSHKDWKWIPSVQVTEDGNYPNTSTSYWTLEKH